MKLRNKKTGEIVEPFGITCVNGRTFVQFDDGKGIFKFEAHSLAELNAEWEDYKEPPKEYWYVNSDSLIYATDCGKYPDSDILRKEIGNYFETKEDAEKAVEKLKAWKRLKEAGFRFIDWSPVDGISFKTSDEFFDSNDLIPSYLRDDLDLLFSGEDD